MQCGRGKRVNDPALRLCAADPPVGNGANGKPLHTHRWGAGHAIDHKTDLQYVITWLESNAPAA